MMSRQPNGLWRPEPSQTSTYTEQAQSNGAGPAGRPQSQAGPILRESRWDGRLARARAHVAVVVVYRRGDHQVVWPHERTRVLLHRRPTTVYEVDLGLHRTVITADLPSKDHAGSFHASISIQWRVLNPSAVVRHQVLDIEEALSATLLRQARGIAREFSIDQVTAAEDKINDRLRGVAIDVTAPTRIEQAMRQATELGCLGAEYGLWTRVITHLALDEAATEHNAKMMKLNWAIEEEKAEQELRVLKNKNQQEIMAERIAVYREIVAAGDVERFALRLASHPDEISAITAIIREDQLTSRRDTIDFIARIVDSGVVERWEVSDQVKEALEWLRDATARVVTDKDHRNTQIDQTTHQRRRGRGKPINESAASGPSPEVIIVAAEAVPLEEGTELESSSEVIVGEVEPVSPEALPESAETAIHPKPDN
jgi:hypothetical protein